MRKFPKTMAFMGLITPVGANALGVGEIRLHSALNQVLDADIPLIASSGEADSGIRVNLASPGAFAKAGLDRPYYLSGLRFTPVKKGNQVVVKVTSRDVIREPFLNFLVEVNWPQGRMLREFTVLLDPPATFKTPASPSVSVPVTGSTTVTRSRYPVDAPSNYGFKSVNKAANRPAAPSPSQPPSHVRSRRNDTLWGVASRANRGRGVSQEQMMIALYEANPDAFYKKNVNALKAGHRLKVPSADELKKYTRREALAEFNRQNAAWRGKTDSTPARTVADSKTSKSAAAPTSTKSASGTSGLKLVSPAKGETVSGKVSSSTGKASGAGADLALEMAETVSQENDELRERMKLVEQQLAKMQELLALKDKQLAALAAKNTGGAEPRVVDLEQQGTETTESATVAADPVSAPDAGVSSAAGAAPVSEAAEILPVAEPATETSQPVVESVEADTQIDVAADESAPTELASEVVEEISAITPAETAEGVVTQPEAGPVPDLSEAVPANPVTASSDSATSPAPAVADDSGAASADEPGFLAEMLDQPYYIAAAGGVVFLFALIGWMMIRRRNNIAMVEAESILSAEESVREVAEENAGADVNPGSNADEIGVVAESSFLSEFTPSDFDALETEHDDVDPVSEADVYLAYGRYQQAEDLIRNAIENYPDRDECKLKLLEIHYATEDKDSFASYAGELVSMKTENPDFWAKVMEMGREICPQNALFAEQGGSSFGPDITDDAGMIEGTESVDLEQQSAPFEHIDDSIADDSPQEQEANFGFNVEIPGESDGDEDTRAAAGQFESEAVVQTLDLDGAEDSAMGQEIEFPGVSVDDSSVIEDDTGDAPAEGLTGTVGEETGVMDFNMSTEAAAVESSEPVSVEHENTLDFDMDFGSAGAVDSGAQSEPSEPTDVDVYDLTDMDEIETKLDLAKAYVEMDDQDSARDILSEILDQGTDEQKIEAQALVDVLENKA